MRQPNTYSAYDRLSDATWAMVYAYIMGTPIARSTVNRVLLVGGWCAQFAMEPMPRAT